MERNLTILDGHGFPYSTYSAIQQGHQMPGTILRTSVEQRWSPRLRGKKAAIKKTWMKEKMVKSATQLIIQSSKEEFTFIHV